jgi:hypothetical protein
VKKQNSGEGKYQFCQNSKPSTKNVAIIVSKITLFYGILHSGKTEVLTFSIFLFNLKSLIF